MQSNVNSRKTITLRGIIDKRVNPRERQIIHLVNWNGGNVIVTRLCK